MFNKIKNNILNKNKYNSGFTLVELIVSVSVFAVVMVISMGTIVTVMDANRKSQTLRAVMDNVNSSMENMSKNIRFGTNYHCNSTVGDPTLPLDCADNTSGSDSMIFLDNNGVRTTYYLSGGRIMKTVGGVNYPVTSPDIIIQSLVFRVYGSYLYFGGAPVDRLQPRVIIVIKGYSGGIKASIQTSFILETTISQRKFDFQ